VSNLSSEYKSIMHKVGDYTTKHDEPLVIYNVYDGKAFGNKYASKKGKVLKKKISDVELFGLSSFAFTNIDIDLEVIDAKTMLTHHTWIWNIVNVSPEPKDQIFYYLDGDYSKDFPDMNVKITDNGTNLEIISLSVNKPYRKEFIVKLKEPLKPRQRNRFLKLEYDWEEPDRTFFYKLATDCKKFSYKCTIPKEIQVKNRVLKVDTEMGYKWHASPPPEIKYLKDKTVITWEGKNLKAHDGYKFEW